MNGKAKVRMKNVRRGIVLSFSLFLFAGLFVSVQGGEPRRATPVKYMEQIRYYALKHKIDPRFVQALIWRETRFDASATGADGEIGLMQVRMDTVRDWAKAHHLPEVPAQAEVYNVEKNLQIGVWHLDQALQFWNGYAEQTRLALFEYNAGRNAVLRRLAHCDGNIDQLIRTFQSREYAEDIIRKYLEYSIFAEPDKTLSLFNP